jgi:hypothetical protein
MAALDFREIPQARGGSPRQDAFEQFSRDFLTTLGFSIEEGPGRGADGGRDLIAVESRVGIVGTTEQRWLVSCKHKVHSNASVTPEDEPNILDRAAAHNCQGFLGIYSTLPSSGLAERLKGLSGKIETKVFDGEQIEHHLLTNPHGGIIAKRYFPKSLAAWSTDHPGAAELFADQRSLSCAACGKDLLEPEVLGNLCFVREYPSGRILDVYWSCKGCDRALQRVSKQRFEGIAHLNSWRDLRDLATPVLYMRELMAFFNQFRNKELIIEDEAFDRLKEALLILFTRVSRHQNDGDRDRVESDLSLPDGI